MPALLTITMIWDSNITKVSPNNPSGIGMAFTTSGETNELSVGRAYTTTVTLNTGYILDTVTSNNTNITISDITDNTFILTHTNSSSTSATINITSKSNVQKVSIDLTTLTGWDNVTPGEHTISVVAKATGYLDSAKSVAISFTKASVSTGETWVLNDALSETLVGSYKTKFTSNNKKYSEIQFLYDTDDGIAVWYWDISGDNYDVSYNDMGSPKGWQNTAYKTITFETAPTGELLTWLQANGTKYGGSRVSKNWKFNGTSAFVPQKTYSKHVTISGEAYNDTTFVANFDYIYYSDDWSYITFGSAGFWDISQNQYGKNGGNILKFNTEPSGELLAFLQAHAQPI